MIELVCGPDWGLVRDPGLPSLAVKQYPLAVGSGLPAQAKAKIVGQSEHVASKIILRRTRFAM